MLETLKIKNLAVIDSVEVPFEPGLNILSGETGAGKSIVIEAISLILGSRATSDLIRTGTDEAVVEGVFSTRELPWLNARLADAGFAVEDDTLLVKRVISRAGKHRIYINGSLATLANLQAICEDLVDLCGQHEHQSLLKASTQIELLDRFGGLGKETAAFGKLFSSYRDLRDELAALSGNEGERTRRTDFLRFQIDELRAAELTPDEDEKLQAEKTLLQSSETRLANAESIRRALEDEEAGALGAIRTALAKCRALAAIDENADEIRATLDRALSETEEASLAVNRYLGSVELDPNRFETVQSRLSRLAELRRKYGATTVEMIAMLETLEAELAAFENSETRVKELEAEIAKIEKKLVSAAETLSEKRTKVAKLLGKSVTDELKDLRMNDAKFSVDLDFSTDVSTYGPTLAGNSVAFVVQTNKGEEARPLGKIASGGELSRLMLSIRRVIADRGGIGVYLFDEIDAGIGGQTGFEVGKKLKSVAGFNQVICITHLPQVAAFADHHLVVEKSSTGSRTQTTVLELGKKDRKEEIARMLGGPNLTKKSLENAAELLETAQR
ncbi:MAG: DNA repair protein RecN [Bdellovibrionales bacterium]|nr:DNA repair protein RecN [Bdellovibrionales bacterium]